MAKMVLDHILVRPDAVKETPNIIIPDEQKKKMLEETMVGTVVKVGPGQWNPDGSRAKPGVKEGDRILFDFNSGLVVFVKKHMHRVMREPDVLVILEEGDQTFEKDLVDVVAS